jgi:hypothetical protein
MGYRGKVEEQNRARDLRAQAWTLQEIATELGVWKGTVSVWVRDVEFDEDCRRERELARKAAGQEAARRRGPNKLQLRKRAEIDELVAEGHRRVGTMTEQEFLLAGVALYAGEGSKRDGSVRFANCDPRLIAFYCAWLRHFFAVDESRLRLRLYLHQGLDLDAANEFWSALTAIPLDQFGTPYRAKPDPSIRKAKHIYGCPSINYGCSRTSRAVAGLMTALLSSEALPG